MPEDVVGNGGSTSTSEGAGGDGSSSSSGEGSALESLQRASDSSSDETGSHASDQGDSDGQGQSGAASGADQGGNRGYHVPPREEWERVLTNARTKAVEEVERRFEWAKQYGNPEEVADAYRIRRMLYEMGPKAFAAQLLTEAGEEQEEELVDPEPDLYSEPDAKGNRVRTYSEKTFKQAMSNLEKRLTRQLTQRFQPALTAAERFEQNNRIAAMQAEADQTAKEAIEVVSKLPHFTENRAEIGKVFRGIDPAVRRKVGSVAALYMAYNKVLADKVLPTIQQTAQDEVRKADQRKANSSAGNIHPSQGSGQAKPKLVDGDVTGLARHMERLAATMESGA